MTPLDHNPAPQQWEQTERYGRPLRHFKVGISAGALALAWARQEQAPQGAAVLVDQEVSPLGRLSELWPLPAQETVALAVVLRPTLPVDQADAVWLVGGLAAAEAGESLGGGALSTWWPDRVVSPGSDDTLAVSKAEVQLGPGQVRSAVVTLRLAAGRLGAEGSGREQLIEAVLRSFDRWSEQLSDGAASVAAAYESRCKLIGRRLKIALLPKGEARGIAAHIDLNGRLVLESATGMVERISIDGLRQLEPA